MLFVISVLYNISEKEREAFTMKNKGFIISVALSLVMFFGLGLVLSPKSASDTGGSLYYGGTGFLAEPENTLDCIVFGNSDAYSGFVPSTFYECTGLSAYVSGVPNQSMDKINELLEKALEKQAPKTVILEADCLYTESSYIFNKLDRATKLFQYHSRWKELEKTDFTTLPKENGGRDPDRGYVYSCEKLSAQNTMYMSNNICKAELSEGNKAKLSHFVGECRKRGIRVIVLKVPSTDEWNFERSKAVEEFTIGLGAEYLDMNRADDYSIDFENDFKDGGNHQNVFGAKKTTEYIAKYLAGECASESEKKI